ncbi:hypothetical protein VE01_01008 [Pseudogymnoascus verrucosus]|uniref:Homeobox domain-containing protein n=1 Tax=Pseudogymnoascus verrucosus TaxID=342668 RepID=A0A1B8GXG2_9PEZI|nr:uncharacterized protein VE01_01008 [Pseudogymnoascus verrucosus]OBU00543.2 hypothetical protein VE01_01008 [Pseudogymnoascus verrucosus]
MLVTRQCDTVRHNWSSNKLGSPYQPTASRMSNLEPLTTQPDWRDAYSQYLPPTETVLSPPFEQPITSHPVDAPITNQLFAPRPPLSHRHNLAQVEDRQESFSNPPTERPDSAPPVNGLKQEGFRLPEPSNLPELPANSKSSPTLEVKTEAPGPPAESLGQSEVKVDDDDDDDDDDDMLDGEEGVGGEGRPPQTDAERRAERRKMKRFRLTHQQTRFLMSEFAKQAHPDAAHRERLSREIPGLSPRQVQVWFQNRRAKIKRLTADDRERMMKMRAVPDDFDNVQALHSPYGAVHGIGTPLQSPVDYSQNYGDPGMGMRPLMVDTMRRQEHEEHLSPTGLSPAFGHVGFASQGSPDMLSPLSLGGGDRYYSNHLANPGGTGARNSTVYNRHNSMDGYGMQASRQGARPLQPLQLRETMSRSRSESLQSPLRSSMSWKGDSIDYASYPPPGPQSPSSNGRQASIYQGDQPGGNGVNQQQQYDNSTYPNSNIHTSPSHLTYPTSHPANTQPSTPPVSRYRANSATFPSGLDLRSQYRSVSSQSPNQPIPATARAATFASAFSSGGFQSAPLMAPAEFHIPRTPIDAGPREYHLSQLSAPMAPAADFAAAYSQSMSPGRPAATEQSTLGRQHHGLGLEDSQDQPQAQHQPQQQQQGETAHYLRQDEYDLNSMKRRKRTYSMSGSYDGQ